MTTLVTGSSARSRRALDDDVDLVRDRLLVNRAQAGDRNAFDDLYLRYFRRLYRFCLRRLHDPHEAEDVAQEAFTRAWRSLPTFGGDQRFYPWLSVIAANLCTDVMRRRSRSTPVAEFHQGNMAGTEDGGEEVVIAAADSAMAAEAFSHLSERHQRILRLREDVGWSYQRIADHEGVGITAVETLLWRARQALKREFAAVAGNGGTAGVFAGGGLFSLAALRRLLGAPARTARRLAHAAPALALGSAAAATALVIAVGGGTTPGGRDTRRHGRRRPPPAWPTCARRRAPCPIPTAPLPRPRPSPPVARLTPRARPDRGRVRPGPPLSSGTRGREWAPPSRAWAISWGACWTASEGRGSTSSLGDTVDDATTTVGSAVTGATGAVANAAQSLTDGLGSSAPTGSPVSAGQGVVSGALGAAGTVTKGLTGVVGGITATTTTLAH